MNALINAAQNYREQLVFDNQMLQEVVEDMQIPEEKRLEADLRIVANENNINYFDAMIAGMVERMPIADVLSLIKCNHDGNAISAANGC